MKRIVTILAGREHLVGFDEIDQVMWNTVSLLGRHFGGADIEAAVASAGVSGPAAMGKVMSMLRPQLAGRADMTRVAATVKARLAR